METKFIPKYDALYVAEERIKLYKAKNVGLVDLCKETRKFLFSHNLQDHALRIKLDEAIAGKEGG